MAIPREDLPRFAVEAVCGGKRKEEIVIDLTDAGVTQQAAQRMVDEIGRIHQELRPEGPDGLEEKVLQAWLRRGTSLAFVPDKPRATSPEPMRPVALLGNEPGATESDHAIASALVVIFRLFAIVCAVILLVLLFVAIGVASKAGTSLLGALLAPLLQGILIVTGFLAIAELLRLGIAIERNTRRRCSAEHIEAPVATAVDTSAEHVEAPDATCPYCEATVQPTSDGFCPKCNRPIA